MNLLVVSDLHLEALRHETRVVDTAPERLARRERRLAIARDLGLSPHGRWSPIFSLNAQAADLIVLAGDIDVAERGVEWAMVESLAEGKPILYVPGNHELYGESARVIEAMKRRAAECAAPVHVLERDAWVWGGIRFLGTTLWSDFRAGGDPQSAAAAARTQLADYARIRRAEDDAVISPDDTLGWHQQSVAWIEDELRRPFAGPTVVVTHHAPSRRSVHPRYGLDPLRGAFVSDRKDLTRGVALWIHGHTHAAVDYVLPTGCRVVSNPHGYPAERIPGYEPDRIVTVG